METAEKLARKYGADPEKARLAGLLHDCAKNIPAGEAIEYCRENRVFLKDICEFEPSLIHAYLGAHLARAEYGVEDDEIIAAIYYHTTGEDDMELLTRILYVADTIEPNRTQVGVEALRELAFKDLDAALMRCIDSTIRHIVNKGGILDCDTIAARNSLLIEKKKREMGK
jgi:predicted HD superfamily hydrolase involved in NAD metabolism